MTCLLELKNISFYQGKTNILQDINLCLEKGKVLGILGVNGSGKSTTLKIAAGILTSSTGNRVKSNSLSIGFLPETPPLIETWSVYGFLTHVCILQNLKKEEHNKKIKRIIELCDLSSIKNVTISTLSKGNRQRVAIAQSLIHEPNILILDEPTSGLDPKQINQFRKLILKLKKHTAILLSSHIMHEIISICDSVTIINQGKIKDTITIDKKSIIIVFFTDISSSLLSSLPQWQSGNGKSHQFNISSSNEQIELIEYLIDNKYPIHKIIGAEQVLENTFLQLIGQSK